MFCGKIKYKKIITSERDLIIVWILVTTTMSKRNLGFQFTNGLYRLPANWL